MNKLAIFQQIEKKHRRNREETEKKVIFQTSHHLDFFPRRIRQKKGKGAEKTEK